MILLIAWIVFGLAFVSADYLLPWAVLGICLYLLLLDVARKAVQQ